MISYFLLAVLVAYIFGLGSLLQEVLIIVFHFNKNWRTRLLGSFFGLMILSAISGASIVFLGSLTPAIAVLGGIVTLIGATLLFLWARRYRFPVQVREKAVEHIKIEYRPAVIALFAAYAVLVVSGFYLLFSSTATGAVTTPWQSIRLEYIYVFCLATFTLGMLIFMRLRTSTVLFLIMVHSFLLYSYLPLSQKYLYGADVWRHIATEERLILGQTPQPATITDPSVRTSFMTEIGSMAYSQLWGISALVSEVTLFDLVTVNRWLMPILWSIFLPILIYEIGRSFGFGRRIAVLFAWLSFLPFATQSGGSFTLPVNLGFLFWLGAMLLLFKHANARGSWQMRFLIGVGVLSTFGYTLFALLFWATFVLFEIIAWKQVFNLPEVVFLLLGVGVALPGAEWVFGYGGLLPNVSLWGGLKQFFGTLTGYYLTSGPRPHDITAGNIIINEAPKYSFVANAFTDNRWWLFVFVCLAWAIILFGLYVVYKKGFGSLPDLPGNQAKNPQRDTLCLLFILTGGLLLSYAISRYWLPGEHLLTRRLDTALAFLLVAFFVFGVSTLRLKRSAILGGLLLVSFAAAASYSLGPDTNTVSVDEYSAMSYVAAQEANRTNHCVIAKTYPLLALEAISNKKIVGGGFPITHDFEQPELSAITRADDVSILDVRNALMLTKAEECWILARTGQRMSYYIMQGNVTSTPFGSVTVWRYKN